MRKVKKIPIERLRELFIHDSKTGLFHWRATGKPAFISQTDNGYLRGKFDGVTYYAHRAAWAYIYGSCPDELDHRNGNKGDNRIRNLREVSSAENAVNRPIHPSNKSGIVGVFYNNLRVKSPWRAALKMDGRYVLQQYFDTKQEAAKARKRAEKEYGRVHRNHGRIRENGDHI